MNTESHDPSNTPHGPPWEALERQLEAEKGVFAWLRERPTRQRVALLVLVASLVPAVVLAFSRRADLTVFPSGRLLLDLALLIVPMVLVLAFVLRPLHRPELPTSLTWSLAGFALASIALQASLPQAHVLHAASSLASEAEFARRAFGCFMFGSVLAIPVVLALFGLDRRAAPWWRPLLLGVVLAATLGDLAVYLHCPLTAPLHLLAGHATVVLPLALLWAVGRWVRSRA